MIRSWVLVVLVGCFGILPGCSSSKPTNRLPVFKVTGTITYKSKPVANADVTFYCEAKDKSAFGRTDAAGTFKLTTYGASDGAVAGKHVVTVAKVEAQTDSAPVADINSTSYEPPKANQSTQPVAPKNLIPLRYISVKTSDLTVVVNEDNSNTGIELELKD